MLKKGMNIRHFVMYEGRCRYGGGGGVIGDGKKERGSRTEDRLRESKVISSQDAKMAGSEC